MGNSIYGMSEVSFDTAVMEDDMETSRIKQNQIQNRYNSESEFDSLDAIDEGFDYDEGSDSLNGDEILLNLSPQKYKKPKDELFINFFGMYTKKFVEENSQYPSNDMTTAGKPSDTPRTQQRLQRTTSTYYNEKARQGGNQRVRIDPITHQPLKPKFKV